MGKLQLVRGFAGICTDAALPLYSAASVLSRGFLNERLQTKDYKQKRLQTKDYKKDQKKRLDI